ncbi:hypothetical protein BSL78_01702 [Apostichopus japonicus]|uniref:Ig-like domain-containing protein n=1 Tax=Stichopus japonicus TaxID=307972 RepID=A0A2G8LM83_STIJA|nr:hypothetical protein BSL78_01702 [Apostichopus japonicus]
MTLRNIRQRTAKSESVLTSKRVGFEDAVDYKCTCIPKNDVASVTMYNLYVLGNLTLSTDRNFTNEGSNLTADCCIQFNAHSNDIRLRWLITKKSIENAQTLTQATNTTIDNHKEMCSRLMLKANSEHDGQSLWCRVEEYPSLNSSVTLQVQINETSSDSGNEELIMIVIGGCIITIVILFAALAWKISKSGRAESHYQLSMVATRDFIRNASNTLRRTSRIDERRSGDNGTLPAACHAASRPTVEGKSTADNPGEDNYQNIVPLPPREERTNNGPIHTKGHTFETTGNASDRKCKHSYINVSEKPKESTSEDQVSSSESDDDDIGYALVGARLRALGNQSYNSFASKITNRPMYATVNKEGAKMKK